MKKLASLLTINRLVLTYAYKCNNQNKNFQKKSNVTRIFVYLTMRVPLAQNGHIFWFLKS